MILAVDVAYHGRSARAAGVLFSDWKSAEASKKIVLEIQNVAEYVPGAFYLRELPCIESVIASLDQKPTVIIIDGYVTLGSDDSPGLGMHLWNAAHQQFSVIGVAKTEFIGTPCSMQVFRGHSKRPLFVSSVGIDLEDAKEKIRSMKGDFRVPILLKEVDRLCRQSSF